MHSEVSESGPGVRERAIVVEGVTRTFEHKGRRVDALRGVDVTVDRGELLVLLGPSGCGKSTLLRCIAGLDRPTSGRISIAESVVFDSDAGVDVAAHHRDYGMVFQTYALWPHMTVRKNVAFPLNAKRYSRADRGARVDQMLATIQCSALRDRLPAELSGGQQQRVALARALAPAPQVVLLDEPLSNLDALLRRDMRLELAVGSPGTELEFAL